ncbi:MAG TPA: MmgE/PrpD family protein [Ktedonobacterales bacterium]|nr:MmgE/PrpD family protein [Ktedonobacterales bacterium]
MTPDHAARHADGVTDEVVEFVVNLTWEAVPAEVARIAKEHILDTFGVTLAGSREACAKIVRQTLVLGEGNATVAGTPDKRPPYLAAFANGIASHALDYDDTQLSTSPEAVYGLLTHPSTPVLAAAVAVAEDVGASGQRLLVAYCAGVEVACRVADAINPRHYQAGFHSTGTIGTIGAAAAAGQLLDLDRAQLATAIGIAASMTSGLRENFGTMTKPLHAGRAASNGVAAAYLARNGFTASQHILEARRGFFNAAGGGFSPDKIVGQLGKPFFLESPGVSIKPYPSGSLSHPGQDVILDLVRGHDITPEQVERVEVGTNSNVLNALIYPRPTTDLEGKFSLEYCMAAGIVYRKAGLQEFTDEAVNDPRIQEMLPRMIVRVDPELEQMGYQHVRTRVKVITRDGREYSGEAEWAKGYPLKPLTPEELEGKFLECAQTVLSQQQAVAALEAIKTIETAPTVAQVMATLRIPVAAPAHVHSSQSATE